MDRRARERRRSDYTEPKIRLRTTEDHTGHGPSTQRTRTENDTDRHNQRICSYGRKKITEQDITTHGGHGIATSEQGGGQMPISVRFDAQNQEKTGRRCCRTYTDDPRNSASLLETLQQEGYGAENREQEQRKKLRNRFGSTSSSPREILSSSSSSPFYSS